MPKAQPLHEPTDGLGPVPEQNQPGHHPRVEQDKPSRPPKAPSLVRHFAFRFEPLLLPAALLLGVRPSTSGVDVDGKDVTIRFGRWSMSFPRTDVSSAEVTGPYQLLKVAGPPHLSLADGGVTFATNRHAGACLQLARAHRAIEPLGIIGHRSVTVTVDDPEELCRLLRRA